MVNNVRKDVREKLLEGFLKLKAKNPPQGGWRYKTPRAAHYISVVDGKYCYTTVGYPGTRYHTEEEIENC